MQLWLYLRSLCWYRVYFSHCCHIRDDFCRLLYAEEMPDVQLEQAAKIVTDMATMREVNATPAQTAQVQP